MPLSLLLPLLIGAAAIFVLLPRPRAIPAFVGAVLGLAALGLAGWYFVQGIGWNVETVLYLIFSTIAIVAGVLLVTQRNPARAALSFALVVLSTSGLFLLLAAPFLMAATIVIYAGAIVVTFLFVLMLAQQEGLSDADARSREPLLAVVTGFVLLGALLYVLNNTYVDNVDLVDDMLAVARRAQSQLAAGDATSLNRFPTDLKAPVSRILEDDERQLRQDPNQEEYQEPKASVARVLYAGKLRAILEDQVLADFPTNPETASVSELQAALARVISSLLLVRQEKGFLRTVEIGPQKANPYSSLSGPPANTPAEDLRIDINGRPRMPAENAQYLGRSLFTDFLLPVELAGTLLLVAAVGAIAIAQRRIPRERLP